MKKIVIILMILSLATWAIGETRIDPTKENGFTHIKRIIKYVRWMESRGTDLTLAPPSRRFDMSGFRWKEDDIEHLQYPAETIQKKTGDCEDFTMFFLALAKRTGHSIHQLGFAMIKAHDKVAHLIPLYQEDDNTWWIWESGVVLGMTAPLAWYLNAVENLNYAVMVMGFAEYSTVTTLTKTHWNTDSLFMWMKAEEARIKAKGYATE